MDLDQFLEHLNSGTPVQGGGEAHQFMHGVSQEALRITAQINTGYHEPEELRALFSQLIGAPVDESFGLFPPLLCRPREKHPHWKTGFHQHGLQISGPGGASTSATAPSSATMWCWPP